jgi:ribosomal protein S18 acetylase RimI-like enzyme
MVLKNNPARRLYERAGFVVNGEEGVKYRMKRRPQSIPLDHRSGAIPR